jgi:tricarballylate dehydrogenase
VSAAVFLMLLAGGTAGAAVGRVLRLPLWPLTGALVGAGVVHLAIGNQAAFPSWSVFVAQVLVGSAVGARLGPTVLSEFRHVLAPGVLAVLVTVAAGMALGLALWSTQQVGLMEAVFGMVPGGVGEMVATVASLDGDSALVAGMHLVRLFVVVTVIEAAVRWFHRRSGGVAHERNESFDVVVVGGGNAGFSAALAAAEAGARVCLLEKADRDHAGGNSYYTAGAFRCTFSGLGELRPMLEPDARLEETELDPYAKEDFWADMRRLTDGRCDETLTRVLIEDSADAVRWLAGHGIRWRLMYERQAYRRAGRWRFFGGLVLGTVGGGKGLIAQHTVAADTAGVRVRYSATVTDLLVDDDGHRVTGVAWVDEHGDLQETRAAAVVLAAGGFEADAAKRRDHLGEEWEHAVVRGNPLNTGELLEVALSKGAAAFGDWGSCHSVAWDVAGPPAGGDRTRTNQLTRQSYPLGIVVNRAGRRFVDEGADYRNYTYAKYGREILRQPGAVAFQLFDAKTRPLLRTEEYDADTVTGAQAQDLADLAAQLGVDPDGLAETVQEFNAAIVDRPFDPAVKDGRAARVTPPKSNWAQALDTPPYYGYAVTCGITFTFGGLHVDESARVLARDGHGPITGLYAAGEMVGGLFSGNYPGGTGLTSGTVFGRRAGRDAARVTRPPPPTR